MKFRRPRFLMLSACCRLLAVALLLLWGASAFFNLTYFLGRGGLVALGLGRLGVDRPRPKDPKNLPIQGPGWLVSDVRFLTFELTSPFQKAIWHGSDQTKGGIPRWKDGWILPLPPHLVMLPYASTNSVSPLFLCIPLWMFALIPGAGSLLLDRRARRRRYAGQCLQCGYDRRGAPDDSPCPECGGRSRALNNPPLG